MKTELSGDDLERARRLGLRVCGELAEHARTQTDLANALGISQPAVSRRLLGEVDFRYTELVRTALWLGVPLQQLLPRKDSNLQPAGQSWFRSAA